jgi:hypothetical protein
VTQSRNEFVDRILKERERQFDLPWSELDAANTPNDWASIASSYILSEIRIGGQKPTREDFKDGLCKAAAVILAAFDNIDEMESREQFRPIIDK